MKRSLFFFLEKLSITPGERKTMSYLILTLTFLAAINIVIPAHSDYTQEFYEPVIEEFQQYAESYYQEVSQINARYVADNNTEESSFTSHEAPAERINSARTDTIVNINSANAEELQKLPGIGPSIANNIIRYRNENGKFNSIDDLLHVRGIGKSRLDNIRPYIKL